MSSRLWTFLCVAFGWAAVVGLLLHLVGADPDSPVGLAVIAVLYMPSPFFAALIAERGLVKGRFFVPLDRRLLPFLLLPPALVVTFAVVYLAAVHVGGDVLGIGAIGGLATTTEEFLDGAAALLGADAAAAAGPLPPPLVLLSVAVASAVTAGWTLNGVLAMGEEYGWRGLMWDELKPYGALRANLVTGVAWGLWHAPLILQGYNYPQQPVVGVLAMVGFCMAMSPLLHALRERTSSVVPVAAAHGTFNALAITLLLLTPDADQVLAGPVGALGAAVLLLVGLTFWWLPAPKAARSGPDDSRRDDGARSAP
jgi:membrane protease YdiL (CAAX protease family)